MIKKWMTAFLSAVLVFSLAACAGQGTSSDTTDSSKQESAQGTETTTAITETTAESQPSESEEPDTAQTKILVAYFSAMGNTKPIAETIAVLIGGDLYEIVPTNPYTDEDLNYSNDDCRANQEQNDDSARPEISGAVENMDEYDTAELIK